MLRHNSRKHERVPSLVRVKLRWCGPSGEAHIATGKALDFSESGLRVQLTEPIPLRSYIILDAPELNLAASVAWVRHCFQKGMKYIVGLEFGTAVQAPLNSLKLVEPVPTTGSSELTEK
jgi:PilZ domain